MPEFLAASRDDGEQVPGWCIPDATEVLAPSGPSYRMAKTCQIEGPICNLKDPLVRELMHLVWILGNTSDSLRAHELFEVRVRCVP